MKIKGIEGLTADQIKWELDRGGRFVFFEYCISVIVMTFRQPSDVYLIKQGESPVNKIIGFSLISLFLGWWGIPWGPIYTVGTLVTNLKGGKDVTNEVLAAASAPVPKEA